MRAADASELLKALSGGGALSQAELFGLIRRAEVRSVYESRKENFEKLNVGYEDFTRLLCLLLYLRRQKGGLSNP